MKKTQWVLGLSLSGVLVISSTAFALSSGTNSLDGKKQVIVHTSAVTNAKTSEADKAKTPEVVKAKTQSNSVNKIANSAPAIQRTVTSTQGNNSNLPQAPVKPNIPNQNPGLNNGGYGMNGFGGGNGRAYGGGGYGMMGGGSGMMGGYGLNGNTNYGMMSSYAGSNYGCFAGGYDALSLGINLANGVVENSDQAISIAQAYVDVLNQGFVIDELHEFSDSYEVELSEESGLKAYEFIIDKNGGYISSEMGPNTMWNTKYGHMNWGNVGPMTVSVAQATQAAKAYVTQMGQAYSLEESPEQAPGYYEFMILMNGKDYAELDVNGYTEQVWFENWHGPIINTIEKSEIPKDQVSSNS